MLVEDANTISTFISHAQLSSLGELDGAADVVVLCGSAILNCAEHVFGAIRDRGISVCRTLVICGGVGHSTQLLYDAVRAHPRYAPAIDDVQMPCAESRLLYAIGLRYFGLGDHTTLLSGEAPAAGAVSVGSGKVRVIVEEKSTNCGANAIETVALLRRHAEQIGSVRSLVIVQDPTMSRRTLASFQKAYGLLHPPAQDDGPFPPAGPESDVRTQTQTQATEAEGQEIVPTMRCCPTFVPALLPLASAAGASGSGSGTDPGSGAGAGAAAADVSSLQYAPARGLSSSAGLWAPQRFLDLLLGEVPRMRDDAAGYGPAGKGFIAHVDIPQEVEAAFTRLSAVVASNR